MRDVFKDLGLGNLAEKIALLEFELRSGFGTRGGLEPSIGMISAKAAELAATEIRIGGTSGRRGTMGLITDTALSRTPSAEDLRNAQILNELIVDLTKTQAIMDDVLRNMLTATSDQRDANSDQKEAAATLKGAANELKNGAKRNTRVHTEGGGASGGF